MMLENLAESLNMALLPANTRSQGMMKQDAFRASIGALERTDRALAQRYF